MLDSTVRPLIDPPLNVMGRALAARGVSANGVTLVAMLVGLGAAAAVATGAFSLGFALIVVNRLMDGVDGAVARASGKTDFGGYLDIFADFVFYAAIPAAFAVADPAAHALAAAVLLASFILAGVSFLGYAIVAGQRGMTTTAQGEKSFYYMAGLAEGTETIAVFLLVTARPDWFVPVAYTYAVVCAVTGFSRLAMGWRTFR
ncbi:MAG: CDP-alcohol phosphatidyltransferase family protein [Acidobacteriota bacterium]